MKTLLINLGKKSKKAISKQINTKKKNKILKNYFQLIEKNRKLIIHANKKDVNNANKKNLKDNLIKSCLLYTSPSPRDLG